MRKTIIIFILAFVVGIHADAQKEFTLDSCRAMALRNNKQLNIARVKKDIAYNVRKAENTKYLPHLDIIGGYELTSREISLLNNDEKNMLNNLGTNMAGQAGSSLRTIISSMTQSGIIDPATAQAIGNASSGIGKSMSEAGNNLGNDIRKRFRTNTRNVYGAAVVVTQPVYMGGAIIAANKMAEISEKMVSSDIDLRSQDMISKVDNAYWTIVSIKHKQKLVNSYLTLIKKLDNDVRKMIKEGVATKADGLKVDVKVNEAEMKLTQVENGLALSKMMLCEIIGMPINESITLADEESDNINENTEIPAADVNTAWERRPELRLLDNAVELSTQNTRLIRAQYMPHIGIEGGYIASNPSVFNGFEHKIEGMWNIGIFVQIPVWNWGECAYKVRASKSLQTIAKLELGDAREKVGLQVNQSQFKLSEANKRLIMANKNTECAEENLRCATIGFKEGGMDVTDVMSAQTAWMDAQSQKIDAEVDVKLTQVDLQKVLGVLQY